MGLAFAACNREELFQQGTASEGLSASIPSYQFQDGTRVAVSTNLKTFQWSDGDRIGVYALDSGIEGNAAFTLLQGGGSVGTFLNKLFTLVPNHEYHAFYPFQADATLQNYPVDFTGQIQTENAGTGHIGEKNYMHSSFLADAQGGGYIPFENVAAVFQVQMQAPNANTYTSLTVKTYNDGFVIRGKANMLNGDIYDTEGCDSITLSFGEGIYVEAGETLTANMLVAPKDLSNSHLQFTFKAADGSYYTQDADGLDIQAGQGYLFGGDSVIAYYTYGLTIVGPGAVDEYQCETRAGFESGTKITLKAIPSEGAVFKGWSGAATGTDPEITIDLSECKSVVATFGYETHTYALPDLMQPSSMRKQLYYGMVFSTFSNYSAGFLPVDYNRDGILDVIVCSGYDEDVPIYFFKGTADGQYEEDEQNSGKFLGPDYGPRKWHYGDFNGDGQVDICIVGHGYDAEPWPGASPVFLMSTPSGAYTCTEISETVGFYHGSAVGDVDNDGDLDVLLLNSGDGSTSRLLENDGQGNMTIKGDFLNADVITGSMYSCEFYDLNHDGYLDLIVGGHEHEGKDWHAYTNTTCVFWGNGSDFNNDNYTRFPRFKDGYGVTLDYCFYDLDNDGQEEVINVRTGDGYMATSYQGWSIQILDFDGETFSDVTSDYINDSDNSDTDSQTVVWIDMEEIDGNMYLCGRRAVNAEKLFELKNGKFVSCAGEKETSNAFTEGICLYSDGNGMWNEHTNLGYKDEAYQGTSCIRLSEWSQWTGWAVDFADFMDFSYLEKNNYYLEFAIKNTDPELWIEFAFETRLQTDPWYFPTYHYAYHGEEHSCDGTWEVIRVPLSSMTCDEEFTGYYWDTIKTINIMPGWCHGKDFYLDEIRIRHIVEPADGQSDGTDSGTGTGTIVPGDEHEG